jgi:hypothetical protein
MSKQINFYLDEQLEQRFLYFILDDGGEIFFEQGSNIEPVNVKEFPSSDEKYWFSLFLYKKEFGDITYKEIKNRRYIDIVRSPVIEFSRTVVRDIGRNKEIGTGRLYFQTKFWNSKDELVQKPSELDDWFKLLSNWIKKAALKDKQSGAYISMPLKELANKGYKLM